jgi:hypothetical protein
MKSELEVRLPASLIGSRSDFERRSIHSLESKNRTPPNRNIKETRKGLWCGKFLSTPNGSICLDAAGNLFGTTAGGQVNPGFGAVYEVSPNPDGTWTETTLHLFGHPSDGQWPVGVTLHDGSLFGATSYGGAFGGTNGFGTVFQMKRSPNGQWSYQTIYSFTDGADGAWPNTGVTVGEGKAIYGTTNGGGGTGKNGVVFQLTF